VLARELIIEVVEYSDGVTICAVYARDKAPGRCHRGGVSSESVRWNGHRAKINFDVQVPRGVRFNALTTNGGVRCLNLNSVVQAATTNGDVEVSTSEWASAKTTNGGVRVSMGSAKWSGELKEETTNGSRLQRNSGWMRPRRTVGFARTFRLPYKGISARRLSPGRLAEAAEN